MRRRAVEVEVVLLHILAVIALRIGQAEQPFLQDRVLAVPQGEREAEDLPVVADAAEPVLAPAIGPRPRLVVREVVPGIAAGAVVFAHRAPLPFRQVGAPAAPGGIAVTALGKASMFRRHGHAASSWLAVAWHQPGFQRRAACLVDRGTG